MRGVIIVRALIFTIIVIAGFAADPAAAAPAYPAKPVEIVCPYTPGSSMDIMTRLIADVGSRYMGQPIVVLNKAGAGGSIAAADIISARADGYKLVTLANLFFASTIRTQKIPFDPGDIVPVANFMEYKLGMMVRTDAPWKTFNELLDYAKKNPGKLKWAHTGRGTSIHLAGHYIFKKAGAQTIDVPYKGTPESLSAILGGHVDASSSIYGTVKDQVLAGKVRYLAVYSERRYSDMPNVPTTIELGFPEASRMATYCGLYMHKNTPDDIKAYLVSLSKKIYDDPKFKKGIEQLGEEPDFAGPDLMRERIRKTEEVTIPILKEIGLYVGK
jgi:tripartite-type tricarboxylate transporter receptor subunit TctC